MVQAGLHSTVEDFALILMIEISMVWKMSKTKEVFVRQKIMFAPNLT